MNKAITEKRGPDQLGGAYDSTAFGNALGNDPGTYSNNVGSTGDAGNPVTTVAGGTAYTPTSSGCVGNALLGTAALGNAIGNAPGTTGNDDPG